MQTYFFVFFNSQSFYELPFYIILKGNAKVTIFSYQTTKFFTFFNVFSNVLNSSLFNALLLKLPLLLISMYFRLKRVQRYNLLIGISKQIVIFFLNNIYQP